MQPGDIAHQIVKAVSAGFSGAVQIQPAEPFHNIHMIRYLKIRNHRFAKPLYLDIFAVVAADWNRIVDDVGNHQHPLANLFLQLAFLRLQFLQLRADAGHQLFRFFRLFLFALGHQRTDLLAGHIALVA